MHNCMALIPITVPLNQLSLIILLMGKFLLIVELIKIDPLKANNNITN